MTDAATFEAFMRNYQNMVFSTAMRLTGNLAEAQDISQEVFLKAFERFADLRDNPRAPGWLKTVAINLSLNHLSRYRSRWTLFSDYFRPNEDGVEPEIEFAAPDNVEEDLARTERRQWVEQALRKLPDAQRVPLVLFHLEGLKYEEIAAKLGISLGKVKTDIFRGRDALRKKLAPQLRQDLTGQA
ncbi:MAG TPA: sigma-70 family RNA polymerase sigma factor [Candidatus Saccharimonadales bacterium]|nr:sigma-70 family RNA polymerase sigma factor [Candidatus Saccharimonadales bacterium]